MNIDAPPYVVLLGDVGTGKSTLIEKLTGVSGRSSAADTSFTLMSELLWLPDHTMLICDTPGSNAMADQFMHNVWIAEAINFHPISRILITVKADTRIDNVVQNIKKYLEGFLDLPRMEDVMAVCVTHMDTVTWSEDRFKQLLERQLGVGTVVFSGLDTDPEKLRKDLLEICTLHFDIEVNDDNFLKLFKISNDNVRIIRSTKREVTAFENLYRKFKEVRRNFDEKDQVDLIFEFQAWIEDLIIKSQQRVAEENNFTFYGDSLENEVGHIANMTNQIRTILFSIRTEALGFQSHHGVSELRKCPHCGLVWAKIVGCDGQTTCGARVYEFDVRSPQFGVLATFNFRWDGNTFEVEKAGERRMGDIDENPDDNQEVGHTMESILQQFFGRLRQGQGEPGRTAIKNKRRDGKGIGCGKPIHWKNMAPVSVPTEFCEVTSVTVDDVKLVPEQAERPWKRKYDEARQFVRDQFDATVNFFRRS